jgi:hypothetical protein
MLARLAALVLACLCVAGVSFAQTPAQKRVVLVVGAGDEARARIVMDAIRAQLGDLPVALVVTEGEPPKDLRDRLDFAAAACKKHDAVGAFFIELERPDDMLLYLIEPAATRALVRRVKRPDSDAAGVEELSLIVRSTVSALMEGREIGMEEGPELAPKPPPPKPPPPKPPPPKPPPPKPAVRTSTARLAAHYAGEAFAPESPWLSGLGVELGWSPDSLLFFGVGYIAMPAAEASNDTASIRVTRYPLRAYVGYEVPVDRFRLAGQLGFIAEYSRRATTQTSGQFLATADSDQFVFAVAPRAMGRFEVTDHALIWVGVGLDVFLNNSEYVVEVNGKDEPLLSPYRARARADLGLAVDLW